MDGHGLALRARPRRPSFAEFIIPTPDSVRYAQLLLETLVLTQQARAHDGAHGHGQERWNVNSHLQGGFNP